MSKIIKYLKNLNIIKFLSRTLDKVFSKISSVFAYRKLSELPDIKESLDSVMAKVEPDFLKLGQDLQNMYSDADRLTEQTVNAATFIGGKNKGENFLSNIDKVSKQALSDLQGYQNNISESLKKITGSLEFLGKLINICSVIEKTGISLNVIGLNIAIESSRSTDSGEMFASFTDEIRQLSKNISEISKNIMEDAQTTRSNQISANNNILSGLEMYERLYYNGEKVVKRAIRDIFRLMEISMNVFEKSNRLSREISSQVGEVVVGIQFHDIARQKIEHIVMALNDVEKLINGRNDKDAETDKDKILGRAYNIIGLQASQLREVINEIRNAEEKCSQAFNKLGRLVEDLVADVSVFDTNEDTESMLRKRITALKTGLEQLGSLLFNGRDLQQQINETVEQVSEAVSKLSAHIDQVRGISLELHLKALNAIVKSARLQNEGRALEILAQEVTKLSGQSDLFVTDVVKILQSLVSLSDDLDNSLDLKNISKQDTYKLINEGINETTANYERFKTEASIALEKSQALQTNIINTESDLFFLNNLADELELYLGRFENILKELESWADNADDNVKRKIEEVAQRYTMASERRLHHEHLKQSEPRIPFSKVKDQDIVFDEKQPGNIEFFDFDEQGKDIENKDDIGDNIELFDPGELTGDTGNNDNLGDNIELFDSDTNVEVDLDDASKLNKAGTDKPDSNNPDEDLNDKKLGDKDLGDNVELF